jgi:hypothetical protein
MRVASSYDRNETTNKYSAEDDTQSFRRQALARLQGLLPAQWANTSLSKYQDEYLEEVEAKEEEEYGMETYDYNQQTGVANRTMITIRFQVHYQTYLGQGLLIGGSHPSLGAWDTLAAIPMVWTPGDIWMCEVNSRLYFFENVFSFCLLLLTGKCYHTTAACWDNPQVNEVILGSVSGNTVALVPQK